MANERSECGHTPQPFIVMANERSECGHTTQPFIVMASERSERGHPPQHIDLYDFLDSPTYALASFGPAGTSALRLPQNDDY
jgi:hypothetical protein